MNEKIVIDFECGAANIRAVVLKQIGYILAQQSFPNHTRKKININETTVFGTALFAFYGLGYYTSPQKAIDHIEDQILIIEPNN